MNSDLYKKLQAVADEFQADFAVSLKLPPVEPTVETVDFVHIVSAEVPVVEPVVAPVVPETPPV